MVGSATQRLGDLGGRRLRSATGQSIDSPIDTAVTNAAGREAPESVGEVANQMRGNGFDIPTSAEACRGQLAGVEGVDQVGDCAPLVGYRREYPLALCSAQPHRTRIPGSLIPIE